MHLKRASAAITVFCASFGLVVETISVHAQERVSPDKQWEYQYSDGVEPQIVKAGSICETRQEQTTSTPCPHFRLHITIEDGNDCFSAYDHLSPITNHPVDALNACLFRACRDAQGRRLTLGGSRKDCPHPALWYNPGPSALTDMRSNIRYAYSFVAGRQHFRYHFVCFLPGGRSGTVTFGLVDAVHCG